MTLLELREAGLCVLGTRGQSGAGFLEVLVRCGCGRHVWMNWIRLAKRVKAGCKWRCRPCVCEAKRKHKATEATT